MTQGNAAIRELGLLPGYSTLYSGQGKFIAEAAQNFLLALILSLCFIYMVLAAQSSTICAPPPRLTPDANSSRHAASLSRF